MAFQSSYKSDLLAGLPGGAGPLPTSPTQMRDERTGIALQLFSVLLESARTFVNSVCGVPIARALFPNALVVIFMPVAAELCTL